MADKKKTKKKTPRLTGAAGKTQRTVEKRVKSMGGAANILAQIRKNQGRKK